MEGYKGLQIIVPAYFKSIGFRSAIVQLLCIQPLVIYLRKVCDSMVLLYSRSASTTQVDATGQVCRCCCYTAVAIVYWWGTLLNWYCAIFNYVYTTLKFISIFIFQINKGKSIEDKISFLYLTKFDAYFKNIW